MLIVHSSPATSYDCGERRRTVQRQSLNCRWWDEWDDYTGFNEKTDFTVSCNQDELDVTDRPGPIRNDILILNPGAPTSSMIVDDCLENGIDYVLVTESTWLKLHQWYGGGPALILVDVDGTSRIRLALELRVKTTANNTEGTVFLSREVSGNLPMSLAEGLKLSLLARTP